MAKEIIVDNQGIAYEVEGEVDPEGNLQSDKGRQVSAAPPKEEQDPEPQPKKQEPRPVVRYDNDNARRARAMSDVQVITLEDEPDEEETDEPSEEDLEAWEKELDELIDAKAEEMAAAKVQAEVVRVQSTKDKEIAKTQKRADALELRLQALEAELEEAKLNGLDEDEKANYRDSKALEKKKAEIEKAADELEAVYKEQMLDILDRDYGWCGVERDELEDFDDPEAAEKYCKRVEKAYLAAGGHRPGEEPKTVVKPDAPKDVAKPKNQKPVPAGARAPADIGGEAPGLSKGRPQFNTEQSLEAMAENIENSQWVTVRL